MRRITKPRYLQLAIIVVITVGLFVVTNFYWHVSDQMHININVGMVLCGYGVLQMWLGANAGAIEREREALQDKAEGKAPAVSEVQSQFRRAFRHGAGDEAQTRLDHAQTEPITAIRNPHQAAKDNPVIQ